MTGYDSIAELYDEDMGASAPAGDVDFYLAHARDAGGPVLELGCGTGRITLPLSAAGCRVIGADRSPAMLQVLRRKRPELPVLVMDMRAPALRGTFGRIFCPYSAFTYLVEESDRQAFLGWAVSALAPGGRFVLDVFVPRPEMHALPDSHVFFDYRRQRPDGTWLERRKTLSKDLGRSINSIERRYTILDAYGRSLREIITRETIRFYDPASLSACLEASGLRVVEARGGFYGEPLSDSSRVMAFVCARR
jgi:SAM-dependent methyltransferase